MTIAIPTIPPKEKSTINESPGMRMLLSAYSHLDEAAERLQLSSGMHQRLRNCERSLTVALPILNDEGEI